MLNDTKVFFTEKEKRILERYLEPFLKRLSENDKSLNHMYSIYKPENISNIDIPYMKGFGLLRDKGLIKDDFSLLSKAYYYYEILITKKIKYSKYLCEFLRFIEKNENKIEGGRIYDCELFKKYSDDLNETEIMFIIFLLDNLGLIELYGFGKNPPSNYFIIPREESLNFNRITTKGKEFLRNKCLTRNFNYVKNENIRQEILRRYRNIRKLKSQKMFLLAMVLMGSILEQILRIYYNSDEQFENLKNYAKRDKLINNREANSMSMLNDFRNYIHINVFIKSGDNITENIFNASSQFFEESLNKWRDIFKFKEDLLNN